MTYKKVYIDTNIIRDCIRRRKDSSITLMKEIREQKVECITSIFTLIELWNLEKQESFFFKKMRKHVELNAILSNRNQMDLNESELNDINDELDKFFREYNFVSTVQLVPEGWQFAFNIARTTNIQPGDILHLATALGERCDTLISGDDTFMKEAKKFIKNNKFHLRVVRSKQAETEIKLSTGLLK